jgi:formylglycine-generating enzyme required for sulfatase activity
VTQAQWAALTGSNPSHFRGEQLPVEQLSQADAQAFAAMLSQKEGRHHYRLPTEAEWEYACRAGTRTLFSFGDAEAQLNDYGWYLLNSGNMTHDVATKKPNPWGLYDMHGNVWQWCSDFHGPYHGDETDPVGPQQGDARSSHICRGGSWRDMASTCRSDSRHWAWGPTQQFSYVGFRLVLDYGDTR